MLKSVIVGVTASVLVAILATTLRAPFQTMSKIISTAAARQNTTTAISSPNMNTTFYLFTANHEGVNLTKTGVESAVGKPYNGGVESTVGKPYNVNVDLAAGQHSIFSFKANNEGSLDSSANIVPR